MEKIRRDRDGDRPLAFTGEEIGRGSSGTGGNSGFDKDHTRGWVVRIYRTAGGKFVWSRHRWTRWQGEHDHDEAGVCADGPALLAALRDPGDQSLMPAEAEAWAEACRADAALAPLAAEEIE